MHHILNENNNNFKNSNKKLKQNFESFQKQNQLKINNMVNMISLNANVNNLSISSKNHQGVIAAPISANLTNGDSTFTSNSVLSNESSSEDFAIKTKGTNKSSLQPRLVVKGAFTKNKVKINLNDFSPLVINSKTVDSDSSNENENLSNDEESDRFESILKTVSTVKKVNTSQPLNILPNKISSQIAVSSSSSSSSSNQKAQSVSNYLNKQFSSTIDGKKLVDKNSAKTPINKDFQLVVSQIAVPNNTISEPITASQNTHNQELLNLADINSASFNLTLPTMISIPTTRVITNKSFFAENTNLKPLNQSSIKKIRELLKLDDFRYNLESSYHKKESSFVRNEKSPLKLGSTLNESTKLPQVIKPATTRIQYNQDIILIRKLNGESRLDYAKNRQSRGKNSSNNNTSSTNSPLSNNNDDMNKYQSSYYDNDFPIRIIITDRSRSMAPPCTPNSLEHSCENCLFCTKEAQIREKIQASWLSESHLEKIDIDDSFANINGASTDIKIYQKIKSKKLKQKNEYAHDMGSSTFNNYRDRNMDF